MPSARAAQGSYTVTFEEPAPKHRFRTILGIGSVNKTSRLALSSDSGSNWSSLTRRSIDVATSSTWRRKNNSDRLSVSDIASSIASSSPIGPASQLPEANQPLDLPIDHHIHRPDTTPKPEMTMSDAPQFSSPRRAPLRMDAQDGPWSVSVAETPHDARSLSIYVKTPTHHLTLTRTGSEVVSLHHKLMEVYPTLKLPPLSIDVTMLTPPSKRKSSFLTTLSRLASSSSGHRSPGNVSRTPSISNNISSPPAVDINDPFSAIDGDAAAFLASSTSSTNTTLTGVAAYLTHVANEPNLRQSRVWKRFVRVRTDDLQSVRVERAIKRVRSDLAAHVTQEREQKRSAPGSSATSVNESDSDFTDGNLERESGSGSIANLREAKIQEEDDEGESVELAGVMAAMNGNTFEDPLPTDTVKARQGIPGAVKAELSNGALDNLDTTIVTDTKAVEGDIVSTPTASPSQTTRIPRSHSADRDNTRLSRLFTPSTTTDSTSSAMESNAESTAEDDSSVSISDRRARRKSKKRKDSSEKVPKKSQRKVVVDDFEMLRVLGKGCAGKVLLVRHKTSTDLYALKAITKRHVLAHQELQHTLTEQAVLKRMAADGKDPFVVRLWWSFHDKEHLFLVMDFHPGGDLATQLARWGRLGRDRARFYAAEIVEGVESLHRAGVIYRDLKPENILIGADGHIVLTDFGLSKEFARRTTAVTAPSTPSGTRNEFIPNGTAVTPSWMTEENGREWPGQAPPPDEMTSTFCGTAEYLAPEVIQGLPYTYDVDWWSFGTMLFEMLTGITPFWANNHSEMYVRVLQDELVFPEDKAMDQDTKSLIRGLLQRNPALRMKEPRVKRHPYFSMIDWSHVYYKRYIPPYIPPIDPSNAGDTQNFDDAFLDMEPVYRDEPDETDDSREHTDTERTDGEDSVTTPEQPKSPDLVAQVDEETVDVFDGYSFKGRHSVILDDDEEHTSSGSEHSEDETIETIEGDTTAVDGSVSPPGAETPTDARTPEQRTTSLPEVVDAEPVQGDHVPSTNVSHVVHEPPAPVVAKSRPASGAPKKQVVVAAPRLAKPPRTRREKSGVQALDRYLSETEDEADDVPDHDDEDDDWDFVEADALEDRNVGRGGTTLFARGVVDRYRLAVFRKGSVPTSRLNPRSVSSMTTDSEATVGDSPTPSEKQRRGRNTGLSFRKSPRQFLRPKSPPTAFSAPSSMSATSRQLNASTSATVSHSSSAGLLTPSTSTNTPSLKSKESKASVASPESTSDRSADGERRHAPEPSTPSSKSAGTARVLTKPNRADSSPEDQRGKKLKKGAEKVLSLFASPR